MLECIVLTNGIVQKDRRRQCVDQKLKYFIAQREQLCNVCSQSSDLHKKKNT